MSHATEPASPPAEGLLPGIAEATARAREELRASRRGQPGYDAEGDRLPETAEERADRSERLRKLFESWEQQPDDDPPGAYEEALRAIDEERPHRKLFEGMY